MQVEKNTLSAKITEIVEKATRRLVVSAVTLAGGRTDAKHVVLSDGSQVVVKLPKGNGANLAIEGATIAYLKEHSELPMPKVFYSGEEVLVHEYIVADGTLTSASEPQAAEYLAKLHAISAPYYGFDFDTLYTGVLQPNTKTIKWLDFFAEHRLMFMARQALESGNLEFNTFLRIENLAQHLDKYLDEPEKPSLIHGDIWSSTILCHHGKVKAFVDPAICYADSEFEFAFSAAQSSLSKRFFNYYNEIRPFRSGFFELRQNIYNLYPILFDLKTGDLSVLPRLEKTLHRYGF